MSQNVTVKLLLHLSQVCPDDELRLCRNVLQDVALHSAKHVRAEQLVELVDLLFLGNVSKVGLKRLEIVKLAWGQKVQKVEQLFEVVLERCAGQEQLEVDAVPGQDLEEL